VKFELLGDFRSTAGTAGGCQPYAAETNLTNSAADADPLRDVENHDDGADP
jgi:hypothetical protein